jgi:hypothetical protein
MRSIIIVVAAGAGLLAGCSSGHSSSSNAGSTPAAAASASSPSAGTDSTAGSNSACSAGLTGTEPGVVSVTCTGAAELKVQVDGSTTDMRGGTCQSGGGVWSATVGVLVDETGMHGKYAGPPVSDITVNDTADGKATIQAVIGGKHYFALGTATLQLSADKKTAHIEGKGDRLSDAPDAKIVVDVNC